MSLLPHFRLPGTLLRPYRCMRKRLLYFLTHHTCERRRFKVYLKGFTQIFHWNLVNIQHTIIRFKTNIGVERRRILPEVLALHGIVSRTLKRSCRAAQGAKHLSICAIKNRKGIDFPSAVSCSSNKLCTKGVNAQGLLFCYLL